MPIIFSQSANRIEKTSTMNHCIVFLTVIW